MAGIERHRREEAAFSGELFSRKQIEEYVDGCHHVGLNLLEVVEKVKEDGLKPTILIPSRGAVPIFFQALDYIRKENPGHYLLDPQKTRYYPRGLLSYVSNGIVRENGQVTRGEPSEVDVLTYAFTADVSSNMTDSESQAKSFRESCSRAVVDLLFGDKNSVDLKWNFFLTQKLKREVFGGMQMSPEDIVSSLSSIEKDNKRQIILIDTVISGRAASNITPSFANLNHPVVPILAVDNSTGGRFRKEYRDLIRTSCNATLPYMGSENFNMQIFDFPLISEDQGASLLGLSALNIANFNDAKAFRFTGQTGITQDTILQSCVWFLPPKEYMELFHTFLKVCSRGLDDAGVKQEWNQASARIKQILKKNPQPTQTEIRKILNSKHPPVRIDESSSHIISVLLDERVEKQWAQEFVAQNRA